MSQRKLVLGAALALTLFCTSLACATVERTAHATAGKRAIVVQGKGFFPIMLIDQCSAGAGAHARALGVNLILNESCPTPPERQLSNLSKRQLGVIAMKHRSTSGPKLLGWTFPDEPDNNGWTPAKLERAYPYRRGNPDGRVSFMTTTGRFFRAPFRDTKVSASTISQFARMADVAGFDLYPLNKCQHDYAAVYDAQRQFNRLAGSMPTFQWIETGPIQPQYCGGFRMSPAELTAEAWLAVAGGARGIGFFTHTWTPQHNPYDVRPDLERAIRRFSDLASAVKPGLLGKTLLSGSNSPAIKVVARSGGGKTYVIAVNSIPSPVAVQVHVPRLQPGKLTVFGERRAVTVSDDRFVDNFRPLAVHVYVQRG